MYKKILSYIGKCSYSYWYFYEAIIREYGFKSGLKVHWWDFTWWQLDLMIGSITMKVGVASAIISSHGEVVVLHKSPKHLNDIILSQINAPWERWSGWGKLKKVNKTWSVATINKIWDNEATFLSWGQQG